MEKIVGNMTVKRGMHCFYSCLYNIAVYYGCQLEEADIFFLCHGMDCWYQESGRKNFLTDSLAFFPYDQQVARFSKEINMHVNTDYDQNREANREAIEAAISAGQPVIVMIEPSCLSYHPLDENIENSCHCIFLYGLDWDSQQAYIGDAFVIDAKGNITVFNGKYPLGTILGGMIGYAWFSGNRENYKKKLDKRDIRETIIGQLSAFIDGSGLFHKIAGIKAWEQIFTQFEDCTKMADLLSIIYMIQVRGTYIFKYLIQILEREENQKNKILMSELKQLEEHWNAFIIKILMASQTISEKSQRKAKETGMKVLKEQKEVYHNIISYLQEVQEM